MLSPYARDEKQGDAPQQTQTGEPAAAEQEDPRLRRLESQIEALRQQLESLGRNREDE